MLSQPSLPFALGEEAPARSIDCSPEDLARGEGAVRGRGPRRCSASASPATGSCPASGSSSCASELGDAFVAVEIDSSKGNPHGIPAIAHSVLTEHLVDEPGHPTRDALDQVLDLFRTRLLG